MDKKISKVCCFIMLGFALGMPTVMAVSSLESLGQKERKQPMWKATLQQSFEILDAKAEGEIGVYVKDLTTGEELSFRAEETWYLASGVKLPVAVEVLRQVDSARIALTNTVRFEADDLLDGSEAMQELKPGSYVTIEYLLEQMLIHSDNTATDYLIELVGLARVNAGTREIVPSGFHDITTLSDVRRLAYSGIFSGAARLKNPEIRRLKNIAGDKKKIRALASILGGAVGAPKTDSLDEAFTAYYARNLNSATLKAYGAFLEKVIGGQILKKESGELLLQILTRVETGKLRLKAAFAPEIIWAHKTGTQHARVCDFGYAFRKDHPAEKVLIAACARGFAQVSDGEAALKAVGAAIRDSGVF